MNGRDEKGRYVKGHKSTGGRLSRPKEEMYYRVLMTRCTQKDWQAIVDKAVDQAKRGDSTARKWLSDYLIGAVEQYLDVTSGGQTLQIKVEYVNSPYPASDVSPDSGGDIPEPEEI
jgi:hypothetical protein